MNLLDKLSFGSSAWVLTALVFSVTPVHAQGDDDQITVTGTPIEESTIALQKCIDEGCPPEQDIALSIAHAENQFIAGQYKNSEATLSRSIRRNRQFKASVPVPLSNLYRSSGVIAEHLGEANDYRRATLNVRDVLKDTLGKNDRRVLLADAEVGDSRAKLGFPDEAQRKYENVEKRALELGHTRVASFARLRQAMVRNAEWNASKNSVSALRRLEDALSQLINEPLEDSEDFVLVARVMKARVDRELGRPGATDAIIESFRAMGGTDMPTLLFQEPFARVSRGGFPIKPGLGIFQSNDVERDTTLALNKPRFVDVGFWIRKDGTTEEAEILRSQGPEGWHDAVISNIASRRYAPLSVDATSPGIFQVERYTMTARFAAHTTGTRIRRREPGFRIEKLDLTPENTEELISTEG